MKPGDAVVVAVERGQDLGRVSAFGAAALKKCGIGCDSCGPDTPPETKGQVVRSATDQEAHVVAELRKAENDVRRKVRERVAKHDLPMKVSDTEWQWDRKKLTVYFTAENRVDFRQLVRDLASLFRTRIELRQIGARDEAKRLSGVGRCGREYCCSSWLPELRPVSLGLAKDQRLSLNPSQISGGCGRLLCCLRYEHDFYVSSRKRFPKEGKTVVTSAGRETVEAIDIFRECVLLRAGDGTLRTVMLADLKQDAARHQHSAPGSERAGKVPSSLGTFDEGPTRVSDTKAADAVTPEGRRRPRGRGRRRSKRPGKPNDQPPSGAGPPEDKGGR
ncbi:MAG: regulatory iron-sulfur-containing complex subunit RicT [Gemmatimonadetes bacterium]|nr:regulatory iron-sulfur-containing complex subunit RicT [Gemmatimonadota bacterium]